VSAVVVDIRNLDGS